MKAQKQRTICQIYAVGAGVVFGLLMTGPMTHAATFSDSNLISDEAPQGKSVWGDVDNDGDLDLILTGVDENGFKATKLYRNKLRESQGNFELSVIDAQGLSNPRDQSVTLADHDQDGDLDLFVLGSPDNANIEVRAYRNDGTGVFVLNSSLSTILTDSDSLPQNIIVGGSLMFADLDQDGDLDAVQLIDSSSEPRIRLFENQGRSFLTGISPTILEVKYGGVTYRRGVLAVGDFSQTDSALDLVVTGGAPGKEAVLIFKNVGSGALQDRFGYAELVSNQGGAEGAAIAGDFNNDGWTDLLVFGSSVASKGFLRCLNLGGISLSCDVKSIKIQGNVSAAAADVNNDGWMDVVVTGKKIESGEIMICENKNGNFFPNFCVSAISGEGGESGDLSFADMDRDGDLDFMATGAKGTSLVQTTLDPDPLEKEFPNIAPLPPTDGFLASFSGSDLTLTWNPTRETAGETESGFFYEYRMYSDQKTDDIKTGRYGSPLLGTSFLQSNGKSPISAMLSNIPFQEFRWQVRAIDQGLAASQWSEEQVFSGIRNVAGYGFAGITSAPVDEFFVNGWLSFACRNYKDGNPPTPCGGSDYGVKINPLTGEVSGYAWFGSVDANAHPLGWVDFDPNPFPAAPASMPIYYPTRDRRIEGWSRVLALKEEGIAHGFTDWGWTHFGSPSSAYAATLDTTTNELHGFLYIGGGYVDGSQSASDVGLGWVSLNCADLGICAKSNYKVIYNNGTNELEGYGWLGIGSEGANASGGWLSFNCKDQGVCLASDYKVKMDGTSNRFSGYAWLGSADVGNPPIGWIHINENAFPTNVNNDPPTAAFPATFFQNDGVVKVDPEKPTTVKAGQLNGWVRSLTLKEEGEALGQDDWGYIRLQGDPLTPPIGATFNACQVCDENEAECLSCDVYNGFSYSGTCSACTSCSDFENQNGATCTSCDVNACYDYGVNIVDFNSGEFRGWAFSGDPTHETDPITDKGLGWILFQQNKKEGASPEQPPLVAAPYIKAEEGSIYGKGGVGSLETFQPIQEMKNAFLIQSSGNILHFVPEATPGNYSIADPFYRPVKANQYANALGKLDLVATITPVSGGTTNRYGNEVKLPLKNGPMTALELWGTSNPSLLGKVYVINGDLTIDAPLTFQNITDGDGSGLVYVDGNFIIDHAIKTENTSITKTKELASVAFIATGDILIHPQVTSITSVLIALGEKEQTQGLIQTGASNLQLIVNGLLFARKYEFQRTYVGDPNLRPARFPEPAEIIHYDGRFVTNTPPGLRNFAAVLPLAIDIAP